MIHQDSPGGNPTEPTTAHALWSAPFVGSRPITASVTVPGSKSLTNRWLVLAALADGPCRLRSPLHSRDSALMIDALRQLGATVTEVDTGSPFGPDLVVDPIPRPFRPSTLYRSVDCGLAGTVMRFVPPIAALIPGTTTFDGDPHARKRPIAPVVRALRDLGVTVTAEGDGTHESLPLTVHGPSPHTQLKGAELTIDATQSSQFVTAMLMVGSQLHGGLTLIHESTTGGQVPSMPHVEMTVEVLRHVGITVDDSHPARWRVFPGTIAAFDIQVEPDLSNAGPFLAAAVVTGGEVTIPHWPTHTTQGGAHWQQILPLFGAEVELVENTFTVRGPQRVKGVDVNLSAAGELAPTVAAICAVATTPSRLRGIAHLRGHETDRLAALTTEINRLGGCIQETDDGLRCEPAALHRGTFFSYNDHRMATAGAVLGLVVDGVQVENVETTAKTLPQFPTMWRQLVQGTQGVGPGGDI
ncbi:MAG: 3-phosphoshikimate 1-carboxyvinyltransferase [Kocuria sp.]|nr:3-phosphoshikimate 1-carboxyvinyltransferase [Kocuria sp.]